MECRAREDSRVKGSGHARKLTSTSPPLLSSIQENSDFLLQFLDGITRLVIYRYEKSSCASASHGIPQYWNCLVIYNIRNRILYYKKIYRNALINKGIQYSFVGRPDYNRRKF